MFVIDSILTAAEVREFRERLDRGEWEDGARTAGEMAREAKRNEQLPDGSKLAIELGNYLLRKLAGNPRFTSAALPRRIFPPRFNRYGEGQSYGMHVDAAIMPVEGTSHTLRTDISATLFLSDPSEYDGGALEIRESTGGHSVKGAAGTMVLYPATSVHRVTPVTRGVRLAAFFWVESWVSDAGERDLLFELDESIQALRTKVTSDEPELVRLTGVYHNLVRRWAIT